MYSASGVDVSLHSHRGAACCALTFGSFSIMSKAALACFLVLIPSVVRAQDKKNDWKALYGLREGEKIELIEISMKKHVGTFSTVTEEAIQMREAGSDIGVRKENVARVTALDKSHRLRNSLIF